MDRRDFLTAATSLLAAGSPSGGGLLKRTVAQQPEYSFLPRSVGQEVNPGLHPLDKPNILLIFADDLGYHDLSCYDSEIPTPHIDSLARQGARLTDWYVSAPICTPSRYSLLTGQLPLRSKDKLVGPLMTLWAEEQDIGIRENETTLAELLRDGGYPDRHDRKMAPRPWRQEVLSHPSRIRLFLWLHRKSGGLLYVEIRIFTGLVAKRKTGQGGGLCNRSAE